jgi:tetratricopeptide (TPR) repeat protein
MRRAAALALFAAIVALVGCHRPAANPDAPATAAASAAPATAPLDQARSLLNAGDADGALAKLQEAGSTPDSLCLQGAAWAKKAELAPLPTPPPASPGTRGGPPPAPEFKPEELKALEAFERVLEGQPGSACANLGLADLLAPHALRLAAPAKPGERGRRGPPPAAAIASGPDYRPERVLHAYRAAMQADMSSREPVEHLVDFALRVGSLDDADQALQEVIRRDREKPEPLLRYGDFLLNQRKNPVAAIEQYRQALIWRADDPETKAKIADIYIGQAIEAYGKNLYAVADARLREAQKYVTDPVSPQGLKIRDYMGKLNSIRQPAPR